MTLSLTDLAHRALLRLSCVSFCAVCPFISPALQAETAEYQLTRQYGSVLFRVLQEEYLYLVGRFDDFSGTLHLDPDDLEATRLEATVNMASLNMADKNTVELLTSSSIWFNTGIFPEAHFVADAATVLADNQLRLEGELEFVGMRRPWSLDITLMGGADDSLAGSTVGMQAVGSFRRTDFGLDQYMNVAADNVEIEVNVKFNRR